MKVLIAGATGAIGVPLSRTLHAAGHEILGLTRSLEGAAKLRDAGVQPIVADAMDRSALLTAVRGLSADAVVHQLTALTKPPARHGDMSQTNRLRVEGTKNLLDAARAMGAGKFVTQSIIFGYGYTDHGDWLITEDDPFGQPSKDKTNPHVAAMLANEKLVSETAGMTGISLRYGLFYGADVQNYASMLRKRKVPIPAKPDGALSWIHIDDAAKATAAAVEHANAGAYNIVDDKPASWSEMITAMATALDAPPPRSLPAALIRLAAPYMATIVLGTTLRVSNAKAKSELSWKPEYPSLDEGLREMKAALRGSA
jgi:nucleoside-diphosphate-sugar epimerase